MAESVSEIDVVQEENEDEDDVDAIISRANKLLETVNRDRIARAVSTFSNSTLRSPNKHSPQSSSPASTSAVGASPPPQVFTMTSSPVESPIHNVINETVDVDFEEIDNAIDNIHRFCNSFDDLLPDVATRRLRRELFDDSLSSMNLASGGDDEERTRPPSEQVPISTSTNVTSNVAAAPHVDEIIDLSNTQSFSALTTPHHPRSNHFRNDADDDVIIVYSNLNDVVDLVTPSRPTAAISHFANRTKPPTNNVNRTNPVVRPKVSTAVVNLTKSTKSSATKPPQPPPPSHRSRSPIQPANRSQSPTKAHLKCPVCMDSAVDKQPTSTKCGHVFCASCINQAIRLTRKCPMCNTKLSPRMLFRIYL